MYKREEALKDFYNSHPTGGHVTTEEKLVRTLEALEVEMRGDVLDLGCAQGHTCFFAKQMDANPLGIEFSEKRIDKGRQTYPGIELLCMDIHRFVETTNLTFDIIMMFDVIEHLEDPKTLITKAIDILRPGGNIISSTPLRMPYEAHLQVFESVEDFFDKLNPIRAVEDGKSVLARWDK